MGIFDAILNGTGDPNRDEALRMGLLNAGLSLLQSRGRLFPAIGQAGQAGLGAVQQTRAQQDRRRLGDLQEQMLGFQRNAAQREDAIARLPMQSMVKPDFMDNRDVGQPGEAAPTFDMEGYLQRLQGLAGPVRAMQERMALTPKPDRLVVPKDSRVFEGGREVIGVVPDKPQQSSDYRDWMAEVQAGNTQQSFTDWKRANATAGAARTNVPVTVSTDKGYAGLVAAGLAKTDLETVDAGRSAPERIRAARQVKQLLTERPITGTLAEQRLMLSKALATAGVISEDSAAATETLGASLASQALAAIKSSGLGAGSGFSNADRDFLERASAGKIDMTPGSIARIADLNEKAGMRAIERANSTIKRLQGSPNLGPDVRGALELIQPPGEFKLPTAAEIQAEIARRQGAR